MMRRAGLVLLALVMLAAIAAPLIAPNPPETTFRDLPFAPPSRVYVIDPAGNVVPPFMYPQRLVSRLERRYEEDRSRPQPIRWLHNGRLLTVTYAGAPLMLLGADSFGRDIFSRLLHAARTSLALALVATLGAMLIGIVVGGAAGYAGGLTDEVLSRIADFVIVLPAIYVVLALRAVMPLVLPDADVFLLMAGIFAAVGWPFVARGVRAIVTAERNHEYAHAARALGAGHARMLARHLLPATAGYLAAQATLLLPSFILAEATMSYVGFGFSDRTPSWGSMLLEAANVSVLADFPWTLAPAAAIFTVVLAVNLIVQSPLPVGAQAAMRR
ncbi:MAG TPA: ABC transporter permease [Kofleriaceae bacterium]|nr:ABC transporter permease [Kofleriaceae bacterium]